VRDGVVVEERQGFDPATTNNRMEWAAMIAGLEMAPADEPITIYSDSQLVVKTLNEWAKGWEARGWKRKEGPVKNLDLVQRAWGLKQSRPLARVAWVRGHATSRWNEYADRLATAHLREEPGG
jgi:ribonuclease HI